MKKEEYKALEIEMISFDSEDVIVCSPTTDPDCKWETPREYANA